MSQDRSIAHAFLNTISGEKSRDNGSWRTHSPSRGIYSRSSRKSTTLVVLVCVLLVTSLGSMYCRGWLGGLADSGDALRHHYAAAAASNNDSMNRYGTAHITNTGDGPVLSEPPLSLSKANLGQIRNRTLGFEKIFVLNMPSRTDKLHALRVSAAVTDFDFEVIEGVDGHDIDPKSLSKEFDMSHASVLGVMGAWRGHLNIAERVVKENLASVLVMEDDVDWDVDFRSQLEYYALGSQALLNTTSKQAPPFSPYGDGWDLQFLGHCGIKADSADQRRFLIHNDGSVPARSRFPSRGPDMSPYANTTRVMFKAKEMICTYGYAMTQRTARKLIKNLSIDAYSGPFDVGLGDLCKEEGAAGSGALNCLTTQPPLISSHRSAGSSAKDSDIESHDGESIRTQAESERVARSTRLNLDVLIDDRRDLAVSQWPEEMPDLEDGPIVTEMRNE